MLYLVLAILIEIAGTTALKASEGFTRIGSSIAVIIAYGISLYFLALSLRTIEIGIAYAIWAGIGTAGVTFIGVVVFGEVLTWQTVCGIALIISGLLVLHLFGAIGG